MHDDGNTKLSLDVDKINSVSLRDYSTNNAITFHTGDFYELKLEKGYFWYRGERIEDINQAYEKFCDWINRINN